MALILAAALASRWRLLAGVLAALYLVCALPAAWQTTTWYYERTIVARDLVQGVVSYHRAHADKTLFLTGMDIDQFNSAYVNIPFELYGMPTVWLTPEAAAKLVDKGVKIIGVGVTGLFMSACRSYLEVAPRTPSRAP